MSMELAELNNLPRASEMEELVRLSNELQHMERNLNEEPVSADNAEATVHSLREQGHSIYSHIEEFCEEAESRVLAVGDNWKAHYKK